MTEYNQFDNAFTNNNTDILDMMARNINNKKKIYREFKNNRHSFEKDLARGIEAYYGNTNLNFSPTNNNSYFMSSLPTPYDEQSKQSITSTSTHKTSNIETSDKSSSFDINEISDSDLSSGYSSLPIKKKKNLCSNNKHLKNYYEKDEDAINHIGKCVECKHQLFTLLKEIHNNNVDELNNTDQSNFHEEIPTDPLLSIINNKEIKNIAISIIIGIIIIICCDIYFV